MPSARTLIDWHSHVWLLDHFPPEALVERRTKPGLGDAARGAPALHRDAMQAVDRYVVVGLQLPWIHIPNDFVAEQVAASNGRAIGFASVDPHRPDALVEFQRAVSVPPPRGLKLSPVYQGFDPRMEKALSLDELADRLQVPVMFHVGGVTRPAPPWSTGTRCSSTRSPARSQGSGSSWLISLSPTWAKR